MNEDFRVSQSAHAQEVRTVHILTKAFGCSRSQAIQAIRLQQAQRQLDKNPNPNQGNRQGNLFEPVPQIKRSETKVEEVRKAVLRPADPIHIPAPLLGDTEGEWTTAFICTEDGSVLKQVHTRDVP